MSYQNPSYGQPPHTTGPPGWSRTPRWVWALGGLALFAVVVLALVGAGSLFEDDVDNEAIPADPPAASSTPLTSSPTTDATTSISAGGADSGLDEVILSYFEAVGSATYTTESGLAVPGSLADAYGRYLREISVASEATYGDPMPDVRVESVDGVVTIRDSGGETEYSNIEASEAGVDSFSVEGDPLSARFKLVEGTPTNVHGVEVVSGSMYVNSDSSGRFAMLEVRNGADTPWDIDWTSLFVAADGGAQSQSIELIGPSTIQPGATAFVFWVFDGHPTQSSVSGVLYVAGYVNDFYDASNLEIPIG